MFRRIGAGSGLRAVGHGITLSFPSVSFPASFISVHPQTEKLRALAAKWAGVPAGEQANAQSYLHDFTEALGVQTPQPRGSGYEFEYHVQVIDRRTGKDTTQRVDLYKRDHFVLEAKHTDGGKDAEKVLRAAYSQAKGYAFELPDAPPPFIMVMDIARVLLVWPRVSGRYDDVTLARRFDLRTLGDRPEDIDFLRAVWQDPASLDVRPRAAAVTRAVAERLAELAAALEKRGYEQERVAQFLIRCVFTMFAEDVELLKEKPFQEAIQRYGEMPERFATVVKGLWQAMDVGGVFGLEQLLHFNGHFFHDAEVLPLTREDLAILLLAAKADWREVEPTIFGTLLTRALDPKERHRLGAEYTPREYVERVVRPAVEEPIRERWVPVKTLAYQLFDKGGKKNVNAALKELHDFHVWLRGLRFLDPACGSGNFLYVTLHMVKRIELEVLGTIEAITGHPELSLDDVGPLQFYGIEVKPWAREIAELTLWIGYHQFRLEHFKGGKVHEPVLQDTGTLEQRDAVLAWDEKVEVPERSRPDPTPRLTHPVTGKLVPDPNVRLSYIEHRGARQAEWPAADFIVGNPPFMGQFRQREALGDGYVDALRAAYPAVPDAADLVMYWWHKAAKAVASGRTTRAGLITTQSITQKQNRKVIEDAAAVGARVTWAIADHYWNDGSDDARVRVAMTVIANNPGAATLVTVDGDANVVATTSVPCLNADLTAHADVPTAAAVPLRANQGLSSPGFKLHGPGFILPSSEAEHLLLADAHHAEIVKPFLNGKDLTTRPRGVYVIDFALRSEEQVRDYPVLFDIVRSRVKPERDANARAVYRDYWWRFGEPRRDLRTALEEVPRYIGTPDVAKHRLFIFLTSTVAPDNKLTVVASDDAYLLGVLSSGVHNVWSLAAGSRLGIDGTPCYNKGPCFDSFPFPDPAPELRTKIADVAERLDKHRKDALARDERVTMTGMYNVVEKLRSGEALTTKARDVHEIAACGVLRDLHDTLDRLVAEAYGWPWPMERDEILERLVALHDERVAEEKQGRVRWLRPEYQVPRFGRGDVPAAAGPALPAEAAQAPAAASGKRPWPGSAIEQITELKSLVAAAPATAEDAATEFARAPAELVRRHLETLVLVGEVRQDEHGRFAAVAEPL